MNDATGNDELRFFLQRGFGKEMGFGDKPALLVVDIMRAFTDADLPLGANLDFQVGQINRLLDAAHQATCRSFYRSSLTTRRTAVTPASGLAR